MAKITAIAWKDTLLAFSSRSQLLFFIILPVIFTLILGGAFSSDGEDSGIVILVVDQDGSQLSAALIDELDQMGTISPELLPVAEAAERFADEDVPALLTIPAGFGAALLDGQPSAIELQKAFNDFGAEAADQAVASAVTTISGPLIVGQSSLDAMEARQSFPTEEARSTAYRQGVALAQEQLAQSPKRIVVTGPAGAGEENGYDPAAHASVGQLVTWVFIPLLGTSAFFALERTRGTLRRLVVSPTRKGTFLMGTISGQMGQAMVQMTLLILFGVFVMGVNWGQSVPALAVMLVAFALASVALGAALGTFVKTESQAASLSIAAGMVMALLGGAWYPMEIFPEVAQTVAKILPTTWAVQGLSELVMRGGGMADILLPAAVLIGFAVVFFTVGTLRFRYE